MKPHNEWTIGQAAKATGLSAKAIRHYESIGLIAPGQRTESNYRVYGERDLHQLRFIQQARSLGFSMQQIGELLTLWRDPTRRSADVKAVARTHINDINQRIEQLQAMRATLEELVERCRGDDRPDCSILLSLATPKA